MGERGRNLLLAAAALLLPAGALAKPAEVSKSQILLGPVTMEIRSWGDLVRKWRINPDGTGEIWRPSALGPPMNEEEKHPRTISKFRVRFNNQGLRDFIGKIEQLRLAIGRPLKCRKTIFDLDYGSVHWSYPSNAHIFHFDAGCRTKKIDEAMGLLGDADRTIDSSAIVEKAPFSVVPAEGN